MDQYNEKFLIMTDNLFTFQNYSCHSVIDIENLSPGKIKETLKMQGLTNKPIKFAFAPSKGLVRLSERGSINSDRILTELVSLPHKKIDKLLDFFSEYGFIFPVNNESFETIDLNALIKIIDRVKMLVFLMSSIESTKKNYKKILEYVYVLQCNEPTKLNLQCFSRPYQTAPHILCTLLEKANIITDINRSAEEFSSDYYRIKDTIYSPTYNYEIEKYKAIQSGYSGMPGENHSLFYKNIVCLYRNYSYDSYEERLIIDFFFHYQDKIGVINKTSFSESIEYYGDKNTIDKLYLKFFDQRMKDALIDIAKITIRDELNYNLQGVYPSYNVEDMAPSWSISDMLTGIYFSIFYLKPGLELYRKCSNPNCQRWFLVKTTSARRKYCCSDCANATAQRNHRKRKKEK